MAAFSDIMIFGLQLSLDLPRDGEALEPYWRSVAGSHYKQVFVAA
jgi:hypothetical protein